MDALVAMLISKYNYWVYIAIMMIGFYAVIVKRNLIKKVIGLGILQTAIILFFISIGVKKGATLPIIAHDHSGTIHTVQAVDYINPLPHVLMLTAIVVAVATLGVALSLAVKIYQKYDTLEEDEINSQIERQ